MKAFVLLSGALTCGAALAQEPAAPTQVMVQDFEKASAQPATWVVHIPNESAVATFSSNKPFEGKQALKLHYRFTGGEGEPQYLGVPNKVKILAPIHRLRFALMGDSSQSSYAVQVTDASGETHQYKGGLIDFSGWQEKVIDLDPAHETWGGDKNAKMDYPLTGIAFIVSQPTDKAKLPIESDLGFDALRADAEKSAVETLGAQISVVSPAYGADIQGNPRITVAAPGFKSVAVSSWKPGGAFGSRATVANVSLDAKGSGSFVFPANQYPHGPVTLTISGQSGSFKDNCYLQLYNKGGILWNVGLPKAPPAAQGMELVFADDFNKPLSISNTDSKATYYSHKPPNGSQDFSTLPFSDYESPKNPFFQVDSYLRIRADEKKNSSGLISSVHNDASGIKAALPAYFECRFLAPNAIGTWPAFWLMTDYMPQRNAGQPDKDVPVDELDIIEAYGGEGPGSPNSFDAYQIAPHAWNQGEAGKAMENAAVKAVNNPAKMKKFGIPSTWYEAFHTYGCKITETDTIYYCDNIEVARHKTMDASKKHPFFFMINLATGGGWPVDLSRYDGRADMYVDFVRVYQKKP